MDVERLKQLSLAGMPIYIDGIGNIYPVKLKEIVCVGNDIYNQYLSYICISADSFNDEETRKELANATSFMLILSLCTQDNSGYFLKVITNALEFFLKKEVVFISYLNGFFIGSTKELKKILKSVDDETSAIDQFYKNGFIGNDNYESFKKVIMLQNCIGIDTIEEKKYANEKAKKIADDLRRAKEKINKVKAKQGEPLSLFDLISAFSANSRSFNIMNVWDLTMYQFDDQFKRMQMIEEYDVGVRSLLAGGDSKKVDLKHWTRKIKI